MPSRHTPRPPESEREAARLLEHCGFTDVRLIPVEKYRKTADLVAEKDGRRWAIEVRTSTRPLRADASFAPKDEKPLPYPTLETYFAMTWAEKRGQLEATRAAERCDDAMLLIMVEGEPAPAWEKALTRAWDAAGKPDVRFALGCGDTLL